MVWVSIRNFCGNKKSPLVFEKYFFTVFHLAQKNGSFLLMQCMQLKKKKIKLITYKVIWRDLLLHLVLQIIWFQLTVHPLKSFSKKQWDILCCLSKPDWNKHLSFKHFLSLWHLNCILAQFLSTQGCSLPLIIIPGFFLVSIWSKNYPTCV